jgi:type IV pilus assembly protein PilB
MVRASRKIKKLLVDAGLVSEQDWNSAASNGSQPIGTLLTQGLLTESALLETLGTAAGVVPIDLKRVVHDPQASQTLPHEVCVERNILPIAKNGEILTVAVSDPFDVLLLDDLRRISHCNVRPVLSHSGAIKEAADAIFDPGSSKVEELLTKRRPRTSSSRPRPETTHRRSSWSTWSSCAPSRRRRRTSTSSPEKRACAFVIGWTAPCTR